jgi:hypothetical protein
LSGRTFQPKRHIAAKFILPLRIKWNIKIFFPFKYKNPTIFHHQVFTAFFTLEASLKLLAMSKEYFSSGWNIFDLIIVVASLIDLSVESVNGISVLRGMRLVTKFSAFRLSNKTKSFYIVFGEYCFLTLLLNVRHLINLHNFI